MPLQIPALRFHPNCYYRADDRAPLEAWPALIAAVTDLSGNITGVLRTWLARDGSAKAPIANTRRAMAELLGHAVRFGAAQDVLAAGEGVETMLSLKSVLPGLAMVAALSASHLAALLLPPSLRRLYVAADNDAAGHRAATRLIARARDARIEAHLLVPRAEDWNTDVRALTSRIILQDIAAQLAAADAARFLRPPDGPAGPARQRARVKCLRKLTESLQRRRLLVVPRADACSGACSVHGLQGCIEALGSNGLGPGNQLGGRFTNTMAFLRTDVGADTRYGRQDARCAHVDLHHSTFTIDARF